MRARHVDGIRDPREYAVLDVTPPSSTYSITQSWSSAAASPDRIVPFVLVVNCCMLVVNCCMLVEYGLVSTTYQKMRSWSEKVWPTCDA